MATATGYLGFDIGTSALRGTLLNEDGAVVATANATYETKATGSDEREQEPDDWLMALRYVVAQLPFDEIAPRCVGLCGQTPTLVLVDVAGRPVRAAMTWQDTRARAEATELSIRLGDPTRLVGTDLAWSAANLPAKLLWLSRHEPASVAATRWLLQPKDYVAMALTSRPVSDAWSSKGLCRVTDGEPVSEILAACGWPLAACPPIAPGWAAAGTVTEHAAEYFGLTIGLPVSVGWSDALAEVLAAGCFDRRSAFFFSGTSAIVGAPVPRAPLETNGLFFVPDRCTPSALLYGPTQSSGASLSWSGTLLGARPDGMASLALESVDDPPVFVPYLSGERAPWWDADLRAVFLGICAHHGPAEFARAVLNGVFMSARHLLELVELATTIRPGRVEVVGRGVGDPAWECLALGALGTTVAFHDDADLSARGAAMLGAVASGESLETVARRLGAPCRTAVPTPEQIVRSSMTFERYLAAVKMAKHWRALSTRAGWGTISEGSR